MSLKSLQTKIGVPADGVWGPATLRHAAKYYELTPIRAVHFFAQVAHETGNFKAFTENLNYSAQGLAGVWPNRFARDSKANPKEPNVLAENIARKPQEIANNVYANRMGNGDYSSNDGWNFRGRGAIQLTGRANYEEFAKAINRPDVLTNPDIVADELAFESAKFFFDKNKLWTICDGGTSRETIITLTKRINGGTHGLDDRANKTATYAKWLLEGPK